MEHGNMEHGAFELIHEGTITDVRSFLLHHATAAYENLEKISAFYSLLNSQPAVERLQKISLLLHLWF